MSTEAQIKANRANAQHSTGPKTDAGKQTSAQNARTHGLTVSDQTLVTQHSQALEDLLCSYTETYAPQNEADESLIRQLALATIRLRRLEAAEEQLWQQDEPNLDQLAKFERYRASAERSFYRAHKALEALRKERSKTEPITAESQPKPISSVLNHPDLLSAISSFDAPDPTDRLNQFLSSRGLTPIAVAS